MPEFVVLALALVLVLTQVVGEEGWQDSAGHLFDRSSKDGQLVRWADLLDFYIRLDITNQIIQICTVLLWFAVHMLMLLIFIKYGKPLEDD